MAEVPPNTPEDKEAFVTYLRGLPDRDVKGILIGDMNFTPAELASEVERGSPIGQRLTVLYASHVRLLRTNERGQQ